MLDGVKGGTFSKAGPDAKYPFLKTSCVPATPSLGKRRGRAPYKLDALVQKWTRRYNAGCNQVPDKVKEDSMFEADPDAKYPAAVQGYQPYRISCLVDFYSINRIVGVSPYRPQARTRTAVFTRTCEQWTLPTVGHIMY